MRGLIENLVDRTGLEHLTCVHHDDLVCHACNDAEIVRDQYQRHACLLLQIGDEIENLSLNRYIQRGCWLVRDEHGGLARQRHGNHCALQHAAGKLERILSGPLLGFWNLH